MDRQMYAGIYRRMGIWVFIRDQICSYVLRACKCIIYSLHHRKCGIWGYIHELFVSKPK